MPVDPPLEQPYPRPLSGEPVTQLPSGPNEQAGTHAFTVISIFVGGNISPTINKEHRDNRYRRH